MLENACSAMGMMCMYRRHRTIINSWETEKVPEEWETGLLKILPKSGDLSLTGNYRGIMLLEVLYKTVANLIKDRTTPIQESIDHESQCGFRPNRGCTDASFSLRMAVKKRREHGMESWVMLLDLVKAFDRVPRELLWQVLLKFGVPPKLVRLISALHETVNVRFEVDEVQVIIQSIIGVKQGDLLGPQLFTFHIAAIMMAWRTEHNDTYDLCTYRTKRDSQVSSRRWNTGGQSGKGCEEFNMSDSEYADDTGLLFGSRETVERKAPEVNDHFKKWGMQVHEK
jgi:hypothetical protein